MTALLSPDAIAALLLASVHALAAEATALGPRATERPAEGEWSANEVIGHLVEAEARAFNGRIRAILETDAPDLTLLGTMGYSREWLVEKWLRDAKINDLFEGTGQINTLIVARRILGYTSKELA